LPTVRVDTDQRVVTGPDSGSMARKRSDGFGSPRGDGNG
jgi:hypothetical protein